MNTTVCQLTMTLLLSWLFRVMYCRLAGPVSPSSTGNVSSVFNLLISVPLTYLSNHFSTSSPGALNIGSLAGELTPGPWAWVIFVTGAAAPMVVVSGLGFVQDVWRVHKVFASVILALTAYALWLTMRFGTTGDRSVDAQIQQLIDPVGSVFDQVQQGVQDVPVWLSALLFGGGVEVSNRMPRWYREGWHRAGEISGALLTARSPLRGNPRVNAVLPRGVVGPQDWRPRRPPRPRCPLHNCMNPLTDSDKEQA